MADGFARVTIAFYLFCDRAAHSARGHPTMRSQSPLRTSLSKRRRALAKHLPAALTGDSHAVHQARVASRRLRETLPIVGADLDGAKAAKGAKKVRRRMRRLTRALGPVRELEVALGMVAPPPEAGASAGLRPELGRLPRGVGARMWPRCCAAIWRRRASV